MSEAAAVARLDADALEAPPAKPAPARLAEVPPPTRWQSLAHWVLVLLVVYAFLPSFFISEGYANHTDTSLRLTAPSAAHLFGTDTVGRDILARTIYGGQISIIIGITAALLEVVVGILVGALAGYYGGPAGQHPDALYRSHAEYPANFPADRHVQILCGWHPQYRNPGPHLQRQRHRHRVDHRFDPVGLTWRASCGQNSCRSSSASTSWPLAVLARRPARSSLGISCPTPLLPIVVAATLGVANAITLEAYISFLGLGVRPPTATWGNMLEGAYNYIESAYWLWLFPRPVDRPHRDEHQFPGRRSARRPGPPQPHRMSNLLQVSNLRTQRFNTPEGHGLCRQWGILPPG